MKDKGNKPSKLSGLYYNCMKKVAWLVLLILGVFLLVTKGNGLLLNQAKVTIIFLCFSAVSVFFIIFVLKSLQKYERNYVYLNRRICHKHQRLEVVSNLLDLSEQELRKVIDRNKDEFFCELLTDLKFKGDIKAFRKELLNEFFRCRISLKAVCLPKKPSIYKIVQIIFGYSDKTVLKSFY